MTSLATPKPGPPWTLSLNAWRATPAATAAKFSDGQWHRVQHLQVISDAVARIAEGPVFLIFSMPPRHGKSELLSHWTPDWFLANWPWKRVGLAAYGAEFAKSWGRKARDSVIQHGDDLGIQVRIDQSAADNWALLEGGSMMTAGVGGPMTGRGYDLLIIDDPIKNHQEANSQVYRDHLWEWYRSTARTRLEPGGSIIIVMTRWHEDDLVGRLLNPEYQEQTELADPWEHIKFPALAEPGDPLERNEGEPLWPARYDLAALETLRVVEGPLNWAGLYQQRPTQEGGAIFKEHWWQYLTAPPEGISRTIQFWDTAFKPGRENDFSACCTISEVPDGYYVWDVWRRKLEFPELQRQVAQRFQTFRPGRVFIEDAASGQSLVQTLRKTGRIPALAANVEQGKQIRANSVTGTIEAGKVFLPAGAPWLRDFIDETSAFPNGAHDDMVDAFVGALSRLIQSGGWAPVN